MVDKNELAEDMYEVAYDELTSGEKAAVDRAIARQEDRESDGSDFDPFASMDVDDCGPASPSEGADIVTGTNEVSFGRPGVNGVKTSLVVDGTTAEEAFAQTGLTINKSKEGLLIKRSNRYDEGRTLLYTDKVYDGDLIIIAPGVDSSL